MRLRTAVLLGSALAAAFVLSLCDHSAIRISSLPQRQHRATFRSRFSGSVTVSQLRPSPSGVLYVAISGSDGSAVSGEVVRLDPAGTARLVWSGVLDDWPDVRFIGSQVIVVSTYRYIRLSESGQVLEKRKTDDHVASCVQGQHLWLSTNRRLTNVASGEVLRFRAWPSFPRTDDRCESTASTLAVIARTGVHETFFARGPAGTTAITLQSNRWWDIAAEGDRTILYARGERANTFVVYDGHETFRVALPEIAGGIRIPPGTSGARLFLLTGDGYAVCTILH
jgi:hypothetical protein